MDFSHFKKLAKKGNLVAIVQTIPADLDTPVSAFLKLAGKNEQAFLLESAEQEEKVGRYSFIGLTPKATLTAFRDKLEVKGIKIPGVTPHTRILDAMQKAMKQFKLANPEVLPGFCGGFVGYLAYENVQHFDAIKLHPRKKTGMPDAIFFLALDFVIFDHFRKNISVVTIADLTSKKNVKGAYQTGLSKIQNQIRLLKAPLPSMKEPKPAPVKVKYHITKKEFTDKVRKIKEYVRAGDCIQVVLSQRFTLPVPKNDFRIYRALRSINPSPYMFYFRAGKYRLVGSSPEVLVKKTGRAAEVRPIAGTRPRGLTPEQDLRHEENLKRSIKEMAEHLMLVDLGRNDLGRVCEYESVKVKNYAHIERYSHVMHLVSDVVGTLKKGKEGFELLKATFPAGTVSGAPKIRAMQIINELEHEERGPYAGSLGYFSFNQDMDMCITIRTLFSEGKNLYLQAGAGIVKDSNPESEYEETLNKSKALLKAIERQGEF